MTKRNKRQTPIDLFATTIQKAADNNRKGLNSHKVSIDTLRAVYPELTTEQFDAMIEAADRQGLLSVTEDYVMQSDLKDGPTPSNLTQAIIRVQKILIPSQACYYDLSTVDTMAQTILRLGGTIQPMVVKRKGNSEVYELVDGLLQYYSSIRALEISPRGAKINAIIIEETANNEGLILEQLDLFASNNIRAEAPTKPSDAVASNQEIRKKNGDAFKSHASAKAQLTRRRNRGEKLEGYTIIALSSGGFILRKTQ